MEAKRESIIKARHSLEFAIEDLNEFLGHCTKLEAMITYHIVENLSLQRVEIKRLMEAMNETN